MFYIPRNAIWLDWYWSFLKWQDFKCTFKYESIWFIFKCLNLRKSFFMALQISKESSSSKNTLDQKLIQISNTLVKMQIILKAFVLIRNKRSSHFKTKKYKIIRETWVEKCSFLQTNYFKEPFRIKIMLSCFSLRIFWTKYSHALPTNTV